MINRKTDHQKHKFQKGDKVWIRVYNDSNKWIVATIVKRIGKVVYIVKVGLKTWKRHVNQIRPKNDQLMEHPGRLEWDLDKPAEAAEPAEAVKPAPADNNEPEVQMQEATTAEQLEVPSAPRRSTRIRKPPNRLSY